MDTRRVSRQSLRLISGVLRNQRGFGFASILLALLIAAALYFGYFKFQGSGSGERAVGIAAINATRVVACRTNRQNIERSIALWSVNHAGEQPTLDALAKDGIRIPSCPEGGRYSMVGEEVVCSVHK